MEDLTQDISEPPTELKEPEETGHPDSGSCREMTFGERLVGLKFNPSGDDKVDRAKRICAELADMVKYEASSRESSDVSSPLYAHTIGEILNAQMNVVKFLTLKY